MCPRIPAQFESRPYAGSRDSPPTARMAQRAQADRYGVPGIRFGFAERAWIPCWAAPDGCSQELSGLIRRETQRLCGLDETSSSRDVDGIDPFMPGLVEQTGHEQDEVKSYARQRRHPYTQSCDPHFPMTHANAEPDRVPLSHWPLSQDSGGVARIAHHAYRARGSDGPHRLVLPCDYWERFRRTRRRQRWRIQSERGSRRSVNAVAAEFTARLDERGCGVLSGVDPEADIGVDMARYRILGACNLRFAHEALKIEDELAGLRPCNPIARGPRARGSRHSGQPRRTCDSGSLKPSHRPRACSAIHTLTSPPLRARTLVQWPSPPRDLRS